MANAFAIREILPTEYPLWDAFVDTSIQGNIFNKSWWLEVVADQFKILVCEDGKEIIGGIALPYQYKYFFKNPKLTPTLGILFKDFSEVSQTKKLSKEIEIMNSLISNLPKYKLFDYTFSYNFQNWLPFKWQNFKIDVVYTYAFDDLSDINKIYDGFKSNIKSDIKKATKNGLKVIDTLSIDNFIELNYKTYRRQSLEMPYSEDFLHKLDQVLIENDSRKIFFAKDEKNQIHAGVYLLIDKDTVYYLMGGGDPSLRNSGATSLLIWEALKYSSSLNKKFDFEGSSVPNIEVFFRAFGGTLKPILRIYKGSTLTLGLINILKSQKNLLRKIGLFK